MKPWRRGRTRLAVVLGLAALASCAPPRVPVPRLAPGLLRARFAAALESRETRARGVEAELSLWARTRERGKLPGVQARLLLAAPREFRLRIESAFGVGLDCSAAGDTLAAYAPRERLALRVTAAGESLGVADPGALGVRVWSATWRPPPAAWDSIAWVDSLARLSWSDAEGWHALEVGSNGLPVSATLRSRSGFAARVRYRSWQATEGVQWPAVLEFEDSAGGFAATARFHRVRFVGRPARERLRVVLPAGVDRLTADSLERVVERLSGR